MPVQRRRIAGALLTLLFIGTAVALHIWGPRAETRYVVIHADDAGMYPSVNAATIDAMEKGVVSSCSIMVPCPGYEEFAKYAANHPEKDYGVHLTLNCETPSDRWGPLSERGKVASLIDSDGYFWRSTSQTSTHAKVDEVELELHAQIDKALASGIRLTHLDHHMSILFQRPDLLRLYVRLGKEYGLPIRYSKALPEPRYLDRNQPELIECYQEELRRLTSRTQPVFEDSDTTNYEIPPHEKRAYYVDYLRRMKPGVSELMIHCAYRTPGAIQAPASHRRETDAKIFSSQDMADELRRQGIQVITWREFLAMTRKN